MGKTFRVCASDEKDVLEFANVSFSNKDDAKEFADEANRMLLYNI